MKVIIIEDEKPAVEKLEEMLKRYDPGINVIGKFPSISKSVEWLSDINNETDLIFLDIHLSDGLSFEIFKKIRVQKPIIFITAYDEYAIEAFKLNSIDYLLKPLKFEDLIRSIEKMKSMRANLPESGQQIKLEELSMALSQFQRSYKTRFMVKVGEHIRTITTKDIYMFYAEGRTVYLITSEKKQYIIDYKLEDLEELLDTQMFFRVNRSFILNINAIEDVIVYSNSRLKIKPRIEFDKEIIVSREKVSYLKSWFNGPE